MVVGRGHFIEDTPPKHTRSSFSPSQIQYHGMISPAYLLAFPLEEPSSERNQQNICYRGEMEIESHYRQLLRELDEQRRQGILCDVSVVVEGRPFVAHRNVLLGSSRYFKSLYSSWTGAEPEAGPGANPDTITHLDIITARAFEAILDFMYSAQLVLTGANVIEVMSAASYLQMTDVVQACHAFIQATLDISSKLAKKLTEVDVNSPVASLAMPSSNSISLSAQWSSPTKSLDNLLSTSSWEGSRVYGRDRQGRCSHTRQGGPSIPTFRPPDRPTTTIVEQTSSNNPVEGHGLDDMGFRGEQEEKRALGSKRRKNRKNKDRVRHIMQQADCDNGVSGVSVPTVLLPSGFSSCNQNISGGQQILSGIQGDHGDPQEEAVWSARSWEDIRLQMVLPWGSSIVALKTQLVGADPTLPNRKVMSCKKKFRCPCCSFSAAHQCILKRHLRCHTGERPYPCDTCGKTFTRREHMKRHTQVHNNDKKYTCKVCSQVFLNTTSVSIKHGYHHHGICSHCSGSNSCTRTSTYPTDTEMAAQDFWREKLVTADEEKEAKDREERG
ncbi:zinc finger and BTB domain-containing protein 46-like [Arapaima gigas]